jgi:hypothetical protein
VRSYLKNNQSKKGWGVAQTVDHLPSTQGPKFIPQYCQKKKKNREREREKNGGRKRVST